MSRLRRGESKVLLLLLDRAIEVNEKITLVTVKLAISRSTERRKGKLKNVIQHCVCDDNKNSRTDLRSRSYLCNVEYKILVRTNVHNRLVMNCAC